MAATGANCNAMLQNTPLIEASDTAIEGS
jgi:hypothetical protein